MIVLDSVSKRYKTKSGWNNVLRSVNGRFEEGLNTGIIGRGGAGKSTLFRIMSGAQLPDSGKVRHSGRVSWPLGFSGGVHPNLNAWANIRFICGIYGADPKKIYSFIEDFTELGQYLDMPVSTYSSGMKAKLAFGLSMAIGFDWYLIDEITAVGDAAFKKKCKAEFDKRKKDSTLLVVSHSMATIRQHCDRVAVLDQGQLVFFDDLEEGAEFYQNLELPQGQEREPEERPSFKGGVGVVQKTFIQGWAYTTRNASAPAEVELYVNGVLQATLFANDLRPHLVKDGMHPTGKCGFRFSLDNIDIASGAQVRVQVKGEDTPLNKGEFIFSERLQS